MPFPSNDLNNHHHHHQARGGNGLPPSTGKMNRIDFAPSLDSIDPKYPPSPPLPQQQLPLVANNSSSNTCLDRSTWDVETDHILSYFLSGDVGGDVALRSNDLGFTSTSRPSREDSMSDPVSHSHSLPVTPAVQFYAHTSSSSSSSHHRNNHHYHSNPHRQIGIFQHTRDSHNENSAKSTSFFSSSALSTSHDCVHVKDNRSNPTRSGNSYTLPEGSAVMSKGVVDTEQPKNATQYTLDRCTPTFANMFFDQANTINRMQELQPSSMNDCYSGSENPSPLSPAALIGMSNENLLLPVPSPSTNYKNSVQLNDDRYNHKVMCSLTTTHSTNVDDKAIGLSSTTDSNILTQQNKQSENVSHEVRQQEQQQQQQNSSSSTKSDSLFIPYHPSNRMLPPEKLLEVFPMHLESDFPTSTRVSTMIEKGNDCNGCMASSPPLQNVADTSHKNQQQSCELNSQHPSQGIQSHQSLLETQQSQQIPHPQEQQPVAEQQAQKQVVVPVQPSIMLSGHQFLYTNNAELAAAILTRHHGLFSNSAAPQVESEEKRAKRLERNRESARKSRRKKKERLVTLGAQVSLLQDDIEKERRKYINAIVPFMNKYRLEDITELMQHLMSGQIVQESVSDQTCVVVQQSGPNSRIMRSVLDFQYTTLKQLTLPNYQKMLLWLTQLDESYFTIGKDEYIKRATANPSMLSSNEGKQHDIRAALKNISSKQVGDELFNGSKDEKKVGRKKKQDKDDGTNERPVVTSNAFNGCRTWPLLAFELRLSVDQEERFIATYRQVRNDSSSFGRRYDTLQNYRLQMAAALSTAESLSKAVGSLSHVISRREDKTFARVLRPEQLLVYQTWLNNPNNRKRCGSLVRNKASATVPPIPMNQFMSFPTDVKSSVVLASSQFSTMIPPNTNNIISSSNNMSSETSRYAGRSMNRMDSISKEASLQDICRRLNQVLHISLN